MSHSLRLPITLAHARAAYTVQMRLGSARTPLNLLLDTGSSSFAVHAAAFDPATDTARSDTPYAQTIRYGAGEWLGPVLRSALHLGDGGDTLDVDAMPFALIVSGSVDLGGADGILGLAYRGLNPAHDLSEMLATRGVASSWPWPFASDPSIDAELRAQPIFDLTPCFTALEQAGAVADCFGLQLHRSLLHVAAGANTDAIARDPANSGSLVLGRGHGTALGLHRGPLRTISVLHDLYYNVDLIALKIGDGHWLQAPPLEARYVADHASNAIVDTGCSFLVLESSLFDAVTDALTAIDGELPAQIDASQTLLCGGDGVMNGTVDLARWPTLHLRLGGPHGPVDVDCPPAHYWQRNAFVAGRAVCLLMRCPAHLPNQSLLGLPWLSGHYCEFDRDIRNTGVLRIAPAA